MYAPADSTVLRRSIEAGGPDPLAILAQEGWGVIALCPRGLEPSAHGAWLNAVVDQVVTFLDDEYEVALVSGDESETQKFVAALHAKRRTVTHVLDLAQPIQAPGNGGAQA
jgi:hypothetical protein